jgi:hypothetical protein
MKKISAFWFLIAVSTAWLSVAQAWVGFNCVDKRGGHARFVATSQSVASDYKGLPVFLFGLESKLTTTYLSGGVKMSEGRTLTPNLVKNGWVEYEYSNEWNTFIHLTLPQAVVQDKLLHVNGKNFSAKLEVFYDDIAVEKRVSALTCKGVSKEI